MYNPKLTVALYVYLYYLWFESNRRFRVQATTLQEDEEKLIVEKSFDPRSFPENEEEGTSGELHDGTPPTSGFEKWIIKVEQSINILLTVSKAFSSLMS